MEIDAFARMTYRVLQSTPFEEFQPTLCLPERRNVLTLSGIPKEEETNMRSIALDWADRKAEPNEEYLMAYRKDAEHFLIIRRFEGKFEEATYSRNAK
jgi:hypothetical protein